MNSRFVLVKCDILSSAFSGEKVFDVPLVGGGSFMGVAPVDFCIKGNGGRFESDEPGKGQRVDGFVKGRIIRNGGGVARVMFPDGEDAEVSADILRERPEKPRDSLVGLAGTMVH